MNYLTDSDREGLEKQYIEKAEETARKRDVIYPDNSMLSPKMNNSICNLETFDELMKRDEQRKKDGFEPKIHIKRLIKGDKNQKVKIVPIVQEERLVHDEFSPEVPGDSTGGQGEGEEGEVIGEQPIERGEGEDGDEGEDGEAGEGGGGEHGVSRETFETGKQLAEKLELPNLKNKGKKVATPNWTYDLTDKTNKGQFLDKKETIKKILQRNIELGLVDPDNLDPSKLLVSPNDKIYHTLSREKEYVSQAMVFFLRDYSGSMNGHPTEIICNLHVMLYTLLMYQYNERVIPRFILHDTEAKEVYDFNKYYQLDARGGTYISAGYQKILDLIKEENLDRDYNLYMFQGTDGDDWKESTKEAPQLLNKIVNKCNRTGISIAKTDFRKNQTTTFEHYVKNSEELSKFVENWYNELLRIAIVTDSHNDILEQAIKYLMGE